MPDQNPNRHMPDQNPKKGLPSGKASLPARAAVVVVPVVGLTLVALAVVPTAVRGLVNWIPHSWGIGSVDVPPPHRNGLADLLERLPLGDRGSQGAGVRDQLPRLLSEPQTRPSAKPGSRIFQPETQSAVVRDSLERLIREPVDEAILVIDLDHIDETAILAVLKMYAVRLPPEPPAARFHVKEVDPFHPRVVVHDVLADREYVIDARKAAAAAVVICVADYVLMDALCPKTDMDRSRETGPDAPLSEDALHVLADTLRYIVEHGEPGQTGISASLG